MNFSEERKYIGNLAQTFQVKQYELTDGKAKGVKAIDVKNRAGLSVTVVPDKGLDIYQISYKGQNMNYIAPSGIVSSEYFDSRGIEWLHSSFLGFLSTGGLNSIGSPNEDSGKEYGLHGRLHNTPAEQLAVEIKNETTDPSVRIKGVVNDCVIFGTKLRMTREFNIKYDSCEIEMTDTVENLGFETVPFMILYHYNFGYPLLCENSELIIESLEVTPRNPHSAMAKESWKEVIAPVVGFEEMCYYHKIKANGNKAVVGVKNKNLGIKATIEYDNSVLDQFVQWKMMGTGDYVVGLEPCNATIEGRDHARQNGTLKSIAAGEKITYKFIIKFEDC